MATWSIPVPPGPLTTRVRDRNGNIWERADIVGFWALTPCRPLGERRDWAQLLATVGPLHDVRCPATCPELPPVDQQCVRNEGHPGDTSIWNEHYNRAGAKWVDPPATLPAEVMPVGPCCDMHNQHCEAPADLCCGACTEASHWVILPPHGGTRCVTAPDITVARAARPNYASAVRDAHAAHQEARNA